MTFYDEPCLPRRYFFLQETSQLRLSINAVRFTAAWIIADAILVMGETHPLFIFFHMPVVRTTQAVVITVFSSAAPFPIVTLDLVLISVSTSCPLRSRFQSPNTARIFINFRL